MLAAKHMDQGDAEREMIFHSERPGAFGLFEKDLRRYVYLRYGLIPGDPLGDNLNELGKISIEHMLKNKGADASLGKPSLTCRGASSAETKKFLLMMVLQRKLAISIDPDTAVSLEDIPELAAELYRLVQQRIGAVEG